MGDPHARAGAQHGFDRGDQAAGRVQDLDAAVLGAVVDVGLAVGEYDDLLAGEMADQGLFQALRAPGAALSVKLALGGEAFDQFAHVADDGQEFLAPRFALDEAEEFLAEPAPRKARGHDGDDGGDQRQQPEGDQQEAAGLGLAALDKGEIVHEHEEARLLSPLHQRRRADVNIAAG